MRWHCRLNLASRTAAFHRARVGLSLSRARKVVLLPRPPWPPIPPFACPRRRKRIATVTPTPSYSTAGVRRTRSLRNHALHPNRSLSTLPSVPSTLRHPRALTDETSDVMSPCCRCSPSWKVLRPSTSGNSSCWTIHIRLTPYIPPNQMTGTLVLSMSAR